MAYKVSRIDEPNSTPQGRDLVICRTLIHDINNSMMLIALSVYQIEDAIRYRRQSEAPFLILRDNVAQIKQMLKDLSGQLPSLAYEGVVLTAWDYERLQQFIGYQIAQSYLIAPPDAQITCHVAEFTRGFSCHPVLLSRIVHNLIRNACEAFVRSPPKGRILQIEISVTYDQQTVFIMVSDNGPGIPHHMHKDLFAPEISSKIGGAASHIGFGLVSASDAAASLGGSLSLTQSDGAGSVFVLSLPFLSE